MKFLINFYLESLNYFARKSWQKIREKMTFLTQVTKDYVHDLLCPLRSTGRKEKEKRWSPPALKRKLQQECV